MTLAGGVGVKIGLSTHSGSAVATKVRCMASQHAWVSTLRTLLLTLSALNMVSLDLVARHMCIETHAPSDAPSDSAMGFH